MTTSPYRLFHFDIATENNFGDTLLFTAVKHVFEAYGDGEAFDIYDSRPLRENVGPALVSYINRTADAVLLGGGGLFLSDTNPNRESGWQWRISLDMLEKLEVPIIVFAVGYNRFYGQPDFEHPFSEHVSQVIDKSIFFGLRNHGSIDRVTEYVSEERAENIVFQPCPTTLSKSILPLESALSDDKRIGIQLSNSRRYHGAGADTNSVVESIIRLIPAMEEAGWDVVFTPFTKPDRALASQLSAAVGDHEVIDIFGEDVLSRGMRGLSTIPFLLGCRGHAQMIPFGLGAIPFSFDVHPKLGYFLDDIERPQWLCESGGEDFAAKTLGIVEEAWENREAHRDHLAQVQERFLTITVDNLETIYSRLGGNPSELARRWRPYQQGAWNMARGRFLLEVQRENSIHRHRTFAEAARETEEKLRRAERSNHTAAEDRRILEQAVVREQGRAAGLAASVEELESQNRRLRERIEELESAAEDRAAHGVGRRISSAAEALKKKGKLTS